MKTQTLSQIAYDIVSCNAKFDILSFQYVLTLSDLPDFVRHELAAEIISREPAYAYEATGPDNDAYEQTMLPALLTYMKNTTDRDAEIEFNNAWREGITSYMSNRMKELINNALDEYNSEECVSYDSTNKFITKKATQGVRRWF